MPQDRAREVCINSSWLREQFNVKKTVEYPFKCPHLVGREHFASLHFLELVTVNMLHNKLTLKGKARQGKCLLMRSRFFLW